MNFPTVNAFRNVPTGLEGSPSVPDAKSERTKPAFTVTASPCSTAAADEVVAISDESLARDDALGSLFSRAFDLPAAAMPDFSKTGAVS